MRKVEIQPSANSNVLLLYFIEVGTEKVVSFCFFNYFTYSDLLGRIVGDWVNNGIKPEEQNGLVLKANYELEHGSLEIV